MLRVFLSWDKQSKHPEFGNLKIILQVVYLNLKSIPAALYKALGGFATNGVNLC